MSRSSGSYSWLPGFLRKFLNLDDEKPDYGSSSSYRAPTYSAPPPSRPAATYTPPAPPQRQSYAPTYTAQAPAAPSYAPTYTPPEGTPQRFTSSAGADATPAAGPPPPAPRYTPPAGNGSSAVTPGANVSAGPPEGYVQPIGYALRSYARGALPPQGLEQFTRESRATFTDVWNFYSYWTRFQTEEIFRLGKELVDVVTENLPTGTSSTGPTTIRRIKVTTSNGEEKKVDRVATTETVDPPPVPTPATPPAPPAPTAVFSETVTADDAAVPPGGRDQAADFAARMAASAAEVKADVTVETAAVAKDVAAQAEVAAARTVETAKDAAATAADTAKDAATAAADTAKDAAKNVTDKPKG